MYNKVILMGRICHDLELKTTPNGVSVLSFRLAVERSYQAKGEERKTDFFNLVSWRNTAEFINRYFSKGRMILIEGELQARQYVDKNGANQTVIEVVVSNASFTGEPKQGGQGGNYNNYGNSNYSGNAGNSNYSGSPTYSHPAETQNTPPAMSSGSAQDFVESANDDDYPF